MECGSGVPCSPTVACGLLMSPISLFNIVNNGTSSLKRILHEDLMIAWCLASDICRGLQYLPRLIGKPVHRTAWRGSRCTEDYLGAVCLSRIPPAMML